MKALPLAPVKLLENSKFCLFATAVGLTALHLILTWRAIGDTDRLIINVLYWGAILCLLWRKRDILNLESGIFSTFFGLLLIAFVLVKSISLFVFESSFVKIVPMIAALGLGLLASGVKGLKQYWRELIILMLLCLPENSLPQIIQNTFNITTLTAKFAILILWYLGFEVSGSGANINLPNGSVWVDTPCTGIVTAILLLKLSVLFMLVVPTNWIKKVLVAIGAVFIAFVASGIRVAIMAVVVSDQKTFDYWHGAEGNQIFSTIAILIFGLLCHFLSSPDKFESSDDMELQ